MSATSKIEWTDRTWNPLTGCTKVSPGCDHCYAKTMHERFNGPGSFDTVELHPERLRQPLSWRKPSMVFVNSMSDLFHHDVPDEYIAMVFAVMARAGQHTFQLLTKRHARMRSLLSSELFRRRMYDALVSLDYAWINEHPLSWPLPNVWLGVSVENQRWANLRIPGLLHTPAAARFLSCEPLLGPIDLALTAECPTFDNGTVGTKTMRRPIDWVIVGGESGHHARPMHPDWARSLRDQCVAAGVPFLFKQWGEYRASGAGIGRLTHKRFAYVGEPDSHGWRQTMERVGKKAAGRELDGRTWDEYPERAA